MMSKEKRRVPKLRFPGFTEDWEQYRFNNLLKKNLERNDGKFNSNKTISIARMKYNKLGNGASDESLNNYKVLRFGDIAFEGHENKEFKYGRFVMNDIGDGIMSPRFTALRPIKVLDVEFWKEYINYEPIMQKKLVNSTKKGTMMHELVVDEFLKQEILLPSKEEQQKIGRLLKLQSNIINLHQRKVEHLILKKKALLQKLFPRNGNRYPDFRFPGFTAPWEQCKFSDITYLSGIKNKENKPYESYSISNEFGFIPQDEQFENGGTMKTADKSMYYIVSQNSFAYNPARINVGSIGYYDKPDNVIVSSLYEVFKTTDIVSDKFLWHWFKSNQFKRLIEKYQEGGVRLYFYYDKLCKGTIDLPTINEQNKISNLLDALDIYITLHQRKLEHLQIQKKSLLQQLFV